MQFQAARGARNYVPQNIETRGEKKPQLRLFNGMVLARQNQVSVEFDQYTQYGLSLSSCEIRPVLVR